MRVLITGAGGNLGQELIPQLQQQGHDLCLLDARPFTTSHESIVADVRDADALNVAAANVDAIVHAAALHGVHLSRFASPDFWTTNVVGTLNVYDAARLNNVPTIVLASSMGIYGKSLEPSSTGWAFVTERTPLRPGDDYELTKQICEDIARYHGRSSGISTVALRFGVFVPTTFDDYGPRLLRGGVDERDAAHAVTLALGLRRRQAFLACNIAASVPFGRDDARALANDPQCVIERYWPGAVAELQACGVTVDWANFRGCVVSTALASKRLGYSSPHGFDAFLEAIAGDGRSRYRAKKQQWGVDA